MQHQGTTWGAWGWGGGGKLSWNTDPRPFAGYDQLCACLIHRHSQAQGKVCAWAVLGPGSAGLLVHVRVVEVLEIAHHNRIGVWVTVSIQVLPELHWKLLSTRHPPAVVSQMSVQPQDRPCNACERQ